MLHLKNNFAISNAGAIESDLPMKHAKDTDRWIKWTDVSSSMPQNDMLIGYSNQSDEYMIRMQNNNDIVCKVPLMLLGYKHMCTPVYINHYGNIRKLTYWQVAKDQWRSRLAAWKKFTFFDGAFDHSMDKYCKKLHR